PLAGEVVHVAPLGPVTDQGGSYGDDPQPPAAPIPVIGIPTEAFVVPTPPPTNDQGVASITLDASDPGNPRGYLDGQIYVVDYRLTGQSNAERQPFDMVVAHVRDAVVPIEQPTWDDVAPILKQ